MAERGVNKDLIFCTGFVSHGRCWQPGTHCSGSEEVEGDRLTLFSSLLSRWQLNFDPFDSVPVFFANHHIELDRGSRLEKHFEVRSGHSISSLTKVASSDVLGLLYNMFRLNGLFANDEGCESVN